MTDAELGYLAGIVDGEGSFNASPRHDSLRLEIANTDRRLMLWLQARVPDGRVFGPYNLGRGRERPCWRWSINGVAAACLAQQLLPYLVLKRRHAELAIVFASTIAKQPTNRRLGVEERATRNQVEAELAVINHKGAVGAVA